MSTIEQVSPRAHIVPITEAMGGVSRPLMDHRSRPGSGKMPSQGSAQLASKLVMRVRFSSPAPNHQFWSEAGRSAPKTLQAELLPLIARARLSA